MRKKSHVFIFQKKNHSLLVKNHLKRTKMSVYNSVINELVSAYFTEYSIFFMTNAFDKVVTELWKTGMLTKSDFKNHPSELTKVILALLLTVLVEHGQLADYRRYIGESGQMTGTLCDIANFPEYCPKLGQIMDYNKWTHHILYIISLLRNNQMFDFHSGGPVSYE